MAETVRFQHYEVLRRDDGSLFELGRGAMGITYKAFDTSLRTNVALKVINATYLDSEVARQRFLREARAAAAIRHPNVATVFHLGNEDDAYFYAMEFIDGETVENFMQRDGAVPTLMALEIAAQVARALGAAEKQGLVHRDIKPSNLMLVCEDGQPSRAGGDDEFLVKVIDFGLAKAAEKDSADTATLTQGGFLGTPHFASPEQLEERELDSRSDIYSLGVTLYYMLAGRTPFSGSLAQVMSQHLHREPPLELLAGQPREVIALLERMMAKDPDARPQTPTDLRREIEALMESVAAASTGTAGGSPAEKTDAATVADAGDMPAGIVPAPGVKLAGHIELIEEYKAGEFGKTFKARDLETGKIVAVLILDPDLLPTSQAYTRLENEVVAVQSVRHPAVIRIHSLERADQLSFVTREWVEGPSLLDAMRRELPAEEAIEILTSLAGGLEAVQKTGVPCPALSAHWVTLVKTDGATLPKFNALNFSAVAPPSPDATMVGLPVTHGGTEYVHTLAVLAYRMFGGMSDPADSFIPIPGISEEANLVLRSALKPRGGFTSPVAFVAALEDGIGRVTPEAPRQPAMQTAMESSSRRKTPITLVVTLALAVLVVALVAAIFLAGRHFQKPQQAGVTPTPTATPIAVATPVPTPPPDPRKVALDEAIKRAEDMAAIEDYAGALNLLKNLETQYPEAVAALQARADGVIAKLGGETEDFLTPEQLGQLSDLLQAASQRGSTPAQMLLGKSYLPDAPGKAFNYFYLAATKGRNSEAMFQLGDLYASGRGMEKPDYPQAVHWFQEAGLHPQAMYSLGECYYFGNGVPRDFKRAWELLNIAANQYGNRNAQLLLGDMFQRGELGKPNYAEAARLYGEAAKKGLNDARAKLILMEFMGQTVDGKPVTGEPVLKFETQKAQVERFKEEADRGNRLAMFYYASCLLSPNLGIADQKAGRELMEKSASMGCTAAKQFCDENDWKYTQPPH
ncbi:MAG: protein kinase domain-containing protein [Chthoniobacterales bacterium]